MGTDGYKVAATLKYAPDEVILEVGAGVSTWFLATIGPRVFSIDPSPAAVERAYSANVTNLLGFAETILRDWDTPIGFAWLDGWDWPYSGNPPGYYDGQRAEYEARGQEYSQEASMRSHLIISELIASHARVIAFDDTWRTHEFRPGLLSQCQETVPPASPPAPQLAMDQISGYPRNVCLLPLTHPHHDNPERGWSGKGGEAIPWLLANGFRVLEHGLGLVVLERGENDL